MLKLYNARNFSQHHKDKEDGGTEEVGVKHLSKNVQIQALNLLNGEQIPCSKDAVDSNEKISQNVKLKIAPSSNDRAAKHHINRSFFVHGNFNTE